MWIHEQPEWPQFEWDDSTVLPLLSDVRHRQGLLLGKLSTLGIDLQREASLSSLTNDVVKSSAIEGETLSRIEVRSSIAAKLGIDLAESVASNRDVEGIVNILVDATQNFENPLSEERLFGWHGSLFPTGRSGMHRITVGNWRPLSAGPMQVVSGPIGKERIHFEAPDASRLSFEMAQFIEWFDTPADIDPVLKAGIAHFWFVTIHPFEDGNGRVARAIGDMALARSENLPLRYYSLSAQIEAKREQYYKVLDEQQRDDLDITPWLVWFLGCLGDAIENAEGTLAHVIYKAAIWGKASTIPLNPRQKTVLNRMLDEGFVGFMNTSKYAKLAKCSPDTALRDIGALVAHGILHKNPGGGRSTSYRLAQSSEL